LVVVLSDHQQGTSKAEREGDKGKGAGKGNAMPFFAPDATKGKVAEAGGKGKTKAAPPAPIATDQQYPYNYSLLQQMYANQAYSPQAYPAQAFQQALQAQIMQAHAQALSAQAYYSQLANQAIVPGASAISAAQLSQQQESASDAEAKAALISKTGTDKEYEGVLKSISAKNGYGFISCSETKDILKRDVFVDSALLPDDLKVGDKVSFALTLSEKRPSSCHDCQEGREVSRAWSLHEFHYGCKNRM